MDKKTSLKKLTKVHFFMKDDDEIEFFMETDDDKKNVVLLVKSTGILDTRDYLKCLQCFIDDMKKQDSYIKKYGEDQMIDAVDAMYEASEFNKDDKIH